MKSFNSLNSFNSLKFFIFSLLHYSAEESQRPAAQRAEE